MKTREAPTIFVVVDEPVIADTLALILRGKDFDARSFYNPEAVLTAAESSAPYLLISDVVMPAMSGIELATRLRTRYPACKVLLFSGRANTASLLEDARTQRNDFEVLNRPVHPTDLLARISLSRPPPPTST